MVSHLDKRYLLKDLDLVLVLFFQLKSKIILQNFFLVQ
jgi:hypothetical protein